MSASYLVRFDDVCPTMNWAVWDRVEKILTDAGVRPLLAVVPDNQDESLRVDAERPEFWSKIRSYQARGWAIGWHGYRHVYETTDAGLIGVKARSEFAGLDLPTQLAKLTAAAQIFRDRDVQPNIWVAPGHSFDENTLKALQHFGIRMVSDGYFPGVIKTMNMTWIPQQLWRFRSMPAGCWTVCYHINSWNERALNEFAASIARFKNQIISFDAAAQNARPLSSFDAVFRTLYGAALRTRGRLRQAAS